ncbi:hypothetical protein ACT4XR_20385 (plasmid) [Acinetobacter baumannii]|uniref:hypothetical protein n=1 Tax=Acinetobacter baumannii TaxID=470 RepID=UPI003892463A
MTFEEITNKIAATVVLLTLISLFPYMGYKFYLVAMDDSHNFVIKYAVLIFISLLFLLAVSISLKFFKILWNKKV